MAGDFRAAGAEILVIMGDNHEHVREYAERLRVLFPVLADPERDVYRRFQLEKEFLVMQRTASVIVDRAGLVRYLKRATLPAQWRAESGELLAAAQRVGPCGGNP
jgi:peroxiredoxin